MKTLITIAALIAVVSLVRADDIPDKYDLAHTRYREIDGRLYDFQQPLRWANETDYWVEKRGDGPLSVNNVDRLGHSTWKPTPGWQKWDELVKEDKEKHWSKFQLKGKIYQFHDGGILVNIGRDDLKIVFLKNHPKQSELVDGDLIDVFAIETGNRQITNVVGGVSTVKVWDFGKIVKR